MSEIHIYKTPNYTRHITKKGVVRRYATISSNVYVCKLHHPTAEEMSAIRAELARGDAKTAVSRRHAIGTVQRLNRLLAKNPADNPAVAPALEERILPALMLAEADVPAPVRQRPKALTDTEIDELLAELGLDG